MPIDRDMRLLDGISMAKGRRIEIADKVHVVRTDPNTKQSVTIVASYREAKRNNDANIRLAAGDVISVEETPVTFTVDMLQSFIRFGFTAGLPGT